MSRDIQAARRDLVLEAALPKLDEFDLIILDDITYDQKDQAENSMVFELIARLYETKSLAMVANQPFSAWDKVFPDHAVTVAAIDRFVHHAAILEMTGDIYHRLDAAARQPTKLQARATTSNDNIMEDTQPPNHSDCSGQARPSWLSAQDKVVDALQWERPPDQSAHSAIMGSKALVYAHIAEIDGSDQAL